jgi:hypothetical protein
MPGATRNNFSQNTSFGLAGTQGGSEFMINGNAAGSNGQSCLMQDEPEGGIGFSRKMSLKERSAMLGIDHQLANRDPVEPGADPGICGGQ